MYHLSNDFVKLQLSEQLDMLILDNTRVSFACAQPISLLWAGAPWITPQNMRHRQVKVTEHEITIELGDFEFPARFPGNNYCRPDKKYVPDFRLAISFALDRADLVVKISPIENLGQHTIWLRVAQNFFSASTRECAQLVLPVNYGLQYNFPRADTYSATYFPSINWTLPVHGLFRTSGGVGLWCEDCDRNYKVEFNTTSSSRLQVNCDEIFDDMANAPREMRFHLFDRGADFNQLGAWCRELRRRSGRFKTLTEKIAEHPEVGQLPGAVFWKHNVFYRERPAGVEKTYSLYVQRPTWHENEGLPNNWTAREVFETAHQNGFDRVTVCNTGWNRDGFDAGYPDRLPPNPERGTVDEWQEAARQAHLLSPGYALMVHDNYIDAYESTGYQESEMVQFARGVPDKKAIWRGGQSHSLCPKCSVKYAQRDMPKLAKLSGRGCVYLDVSAVTPLFCCRSAEHPATRLESWRANRELFGLAKRYFGALAVEGCGTDHYADLVDIGAYGGLHGAVTQQNGWIPLPVPLWQKVYHDSVLNYFGEGYSPVHGSEYWLYQALFTLLPTSFTPQQKRISWELRSAFTAPLVECRDLVPRTVELTADGSYHTQGVTRAEYGDGTIVVVNFNAAPYYYGEEKIPARDFVVLKATP